MATLVVVDSHPQADRWIVAFENVTTVEEAEALRGIELRIPEDARMPLGPDEYYLYDLVGCEVRTAAGVEVGRVQAVYTGAGGALLSVDRNGAEVLVPLVKAMVPEIDVAPTPHRRRSARGVAGREPAAEQRRERAGTR